MLTFAVYVEPAQEQALSAAMRAPRNSNAVDNSELLVTVATHMHTYTHTQTHAHTNTHTSTHMHTHTCPIPLFCCCS